MPYHYDLETVPTGTACRNILPWIKAKGLHDSAKSLPGMARWAERRHIIDTKSLSLEEIECIMTVAADCKRLHNKSTAH